MTRIVDIKGQRFGKWTVLRKGSVRKGGARWVCRCDCGTVHTVNSWTLRNGHSTQCVDCNVATHGGSKDDAYQPWHAMRQRCYNPKYHAYHRYGGRGIRMCQEWRNDYLSFKKWALANGYRNDLQLDRIDNDGNYEPSNCRWITRREQANNRHTNIMLTVMGATKTLREWSCYSGDRRATIYRRYYLGWNKYECVFGRSA